MFDLCCLLPIPNMLSGPELALTGVAEPPLSPTSGEEFFLDPKSLCNGTAMAARTGGGADPRRRAHAIMDVVAEDGSRVFGLEELDVVGMVLNIIAHLQIKQDRCHQ